MPSDVIHQALEEGIKTPDSLPPPPIRQIRKSIYHERMLKAKKDKVCRFVLK